MGNAALPIVVLISGTGSNLQSLIDARDAGTLAADIRRAISNRPSAPGLDRARRAGIEPVALDHHAFEGREDFDAALSRIIDEAQPRLVVLCAFSPTRSWRATRGA